MKKILIITFAAGFITACSDSGPTAPTSEPEVKQQQDQVRDKDQRPTFATDDEADAQ